MRRRRLLPSWVFPGLAILASVAGLSGLKLHFDTLVLTAESAGSAVEESLVLTPEVTEGPNPKRPLAHREATHEEVTATTTGGEGADGREGEEALAATDGESPAGPSLVSDQGTVWVDPDSSGRPWTDLGATTEGLLTFRGNPTRTFHGQGPVPIQPEVQWTFDVGCSISPVAEEAKLWCGTGWTGQPAVFKSPATDDWTVAFGGYDRAVNFLDPKTGERLMSPYLTNDIIKGSVTIDPDGFPILYTGSRDNFFHVVALDREQPTLLWSLTSLPGEPTLWNDDWDGSAMVVDDHLFVGGENSRFYIVKLNRTIGPDGLVAVDPAIVLSTEGWDTELLTAVGDQETSIENSVAISGNTVYFSNSAGLVQGWDLATLDEGATPTRVFRFWSGDDTDASIVVDEEGMLYLGSEYERGNSRAQELGQIIKLDPSNPNDPFVWGVAAQDGFDSGVWATPALYKDLVIVATNEGQVLGLERETGAERWRIELDGPLWSSPVVVDDVLIQGDCSGSLNSFSLISQDPAPLPLWSIDLRAGCIESTPAVWDGQIFVGTRGGRFFAIG